MSRSERMDIDDAKGTEPQEEKPPSHSGRMDVDDAGSKTGRAPSSKIVRGAFANRDDPSSYISRDSDGKMIRLRKSKFTFWQSQ